MCLLSDPLFSLIIYLFLGDPVTFLAERPRQEVGKPPHPCKWVAKQVVVSDAALELVKEVLDPGEEEVLVQDNDQALDSEEEQLQAMH